MLKRSGYSAVRVAIEFNLFILGLIAGIILFYIFFFNFEAARTIGEDSLSLEKAKNVFNAVVSLEASKYVYILIILFVFLTLRFTAFWLKAKRIQSK